MRHLILRNLAKKSCHLESGNESDDSHEEYDIESTVSFPNNGGTGNFPHKENGYTGKTYL